MPIENVEKQENRRDEAWGFFAYEIENLLTTPVSKLPCPLAPKDVILLTQCANEKRAIPGAQLTPELWWYLLRHLADYDGAAIAQRELTVFAPALFEDGRFFQGVYIGDRFPYRERAKFFYDRLVSSGRTFDVVEDYREWCQLLFIDAIKSEIWSYGSTFVRTPLQQECLRQLDAREPIRRDRIHVDLFSAVYQSTMVAAARFHDGDMYGELEEMKQRCFQSE